MYSTEMFRLRTARHSRSVSLRRGNCCLPSAIKNDQRHLLPWNTEDADDGKATNKVQEQKTQSKVVCYVANDVRARQARREKRAARAVAGSERTSEANITELEKIAFLDDARKEPNWGGFAKGEMNWYAMWVTTTHEEEVGMDLANNIANLGMVEDADGNKVERVANPWVPVKMAMKWNGRSRRLTEQPVKYGGGNWLFIECIMDDKVYTLLEQMPVVNGFRQDSCVELRDGFGVMRSFPRPLTDEFLASVNAWMEERADDDLAEVKKELYGVEVDEDTRTVNDRIDGDPEFVETYTADEVDDKGERVRVQRTRYKSEVEYSGTYDNPGGWFDNSWDDGADDAAVAAGAKRGRGKRVDDGGGSQSGEDAASARRGGSSGTASRSATGTFDEFDDLQWDGGVDTAADGDADVATATPGWGESAAAPAGGSAGADGAAVASAGSVGDGPSGGLWDDWGDVAFGPDVVDGGAGAAVPAAGSADEGGKAANGGKGAAEVGAGGVEDEGAWDVWGDDAAAAAGGAAGSDAVARLTTDSGKVDVAAKDGPLLEETAGRGGAPGADDLWGDFSPLGVGDAGAAGAGAGGKSGGGSSMWDVGFDESMDMWGGDDGAGGGGGAAWDSPRGGRGERRESGRGGRRDGDRSGRRDSGRRSSMWDLDEGFDGDFDADGMDSQRGRRGRRSGEFTPGGYSERRGGRDGGRGELGRGRGRDGRGRGGRGRDNAWMYEEGGWRGDEGGVRTERDAQEAAAALWADGGKQIGLRQKEGGRDEEVPAAVKQQRALQSLNMLVDATVEGKPLPEAAVDDGGAGAGARSWGGREDVAGREERSGRGWDDDQGGRRENRRGGREDRGGRWEDRGGRRNDRGGRWEDRAGRWEDRGGQWEDRGGRRNTRGGRRDDRGGQWEDRGGRRNGRGGRRDDRGGQWEDRAGRWEDRGGQWEDRGGRRDGRGGRGGRMQQRRGGMWDEGDDAEFGWERRSGRGRGQERGRGRGGRGQWEEDGGWQESRGQRSEGWDGGWDGGRGGGTQRGGRRRDGAAGDRWEDSRGRGDRGRGAGRVEAAPAPDAGFGGDAWFEGDNSWLDDVFGESAGGPAKRGGGRGGDRGRGSTDTEALRTADNSLWGSFGDDDFGGWDDAGVKSGGPGAAGGRFGDSEGGRGRGRRDGRGRAGDWRRDEGGAKGFADDDFGLPDADLDRLLGSLAEGGDVSGGGSWGEPATGSGRGSATGRGGAQRGEGTANTGFDDVFGGDGFGDAFADAFVDPKDVKGGAGGGASLWADDGAWDADPAEPARGGGRGGWGRGPGRGATKRGGGRSAAPGAGAAAWDSFGDDEFGGPASGGDAFGAWGDRDEGAGGARGGKRGGSDEWDGGPSDFLDEVFGAPSKGDRSERGSGKSAKDVGVGAKIEVSDAHSPFEGMQGVVKGVVDERHVEAELDVFGMKTKKVVRVDDITELEK